MAQAVPQAGQVPHQGVAQKRKLSLLRSALAVLAVSIGLVIVILLLRDTSRRAQRIAEYERCRDWLQDQIIALDRLPAKLGTGQGAAADFSPNVFHYVDDATRFYAGTTTEPVILVRSPPLHQWLAADGRVLVVIEDEQLRVEWVTDQEFRDRQTVQDARAAAALNPDQNEPTPTTLPDP